MTAKDKIFAMLVLCCFAILMWCMEQKPEKQDMIEQHEYKQILGEPVVIDYVKVMKEAGW